MLRSRFTVTHRQIGLDNSGKTTVLYKLKLGEVVTTIPTIGFNVEDVEAFSSTFSLWDIGGRGKMRALWKHYYQNTQALVFVVDATDRERLGEARTMFLEHFREPELNEAVVLVMVNKSDVAGAASAEEVESTLALRELLAARTWRVQACSAHTGSGLWEGLQWLSDTLHGVKSRPSVQAKAAEAVLHGTTASLVSEILHSFGLATEGQDGAHEQSAKTEASTKASIKCIVESSELSDSELSFWLTGGPEALAEELEVAANAEQAAPGLPPWVRGSDLVRCAFLMIAHAQGEPSSILRLLPERLKLLCALRREQGIVSFSQTSQVSLCCRPTSPCMISLSSSSSFL